MGTNSPSIQTNDVVPSVYDRAANSLNRVISNIDQVSKRLNAAGLENTVEEIGVRIDSCSGVVEAVARKISLSKAPISACGEETQKLGRKLEQSKDAAEKLKEQIKEGKSVMDLLHNSVDKLLSSLAKAAVGFSKGQIEDALGLADVQNTAENQLEAVLKNVGSTGMAFDQLKRKAADIQDLTMYSDEAMLAGAKEFAAHLSDTSAIEVMMDALADYAAGMSGGSGIDAGGMAGYAAQLGAALNGNYGSLSENGFTLTGAQKEIIENGSDMQRALVISEVVTASWGGLAERMAALPSGSIVQVKNSLEDMQAELGNRLYPAVAAFYEVIEEHFPQIQALAERFGDILTVVIGHAGTLLGAALNIAAVIADNWDSISPVVYAIVSAYAAWKVVTLAQNIAQAALNSTLAISPIAAICTVIGVIVTAFTLWANKVGGFEIVWLICMDKIKTAWDYVNYGLQIGGAAIMNVFFRLEYGATKLWYAIRDKCSEVVSYIVLRLEEGVNACRDILNGFIGLLNKIPGVNIEFLEHVTWGTEDAAVMAAKRQARADELAQMEQHLESYMQSKENELANILADTRQAHADRLLEIEEARAELNVEERMQTEEDRDGSRDTTEEHIADDVSSIAGSLSATKEEIRYLLDIAERDAINRFTTAQVKVELGGVSNYVNEKQDLDGIVEYIAENVEEQLAITAEACSI